MKLQTVLNNLEGFELYELTEHAFGKRYSSNVNVFQFLFTKKSCCDIIYLGFLIGKPFDVNFLVGGRR